MGNQAGSSQYGNPNSPWGGGGYGGGYGGNAAFSTPGSPVVEGAPSYSDWYQQGFGAGGAGASGDYRGGQYGGITNPMEEYTEQFGGTQGASLFKSQRGLSSQEQEELAQQQMAQEFQFADWQASRMDAGFGEAYQQLVGAEEYALNRADRQYSEQLASQFKHSQASGLRSMYGPTAVAMMEQQQQSVAGIIAQYAAPRSQFIAAATQKMLGPYQQAFETQRGMYEMLWGDIYKHTPKDNSGDAMMAAMMGALGMILA